MRHAAMGWIARSTAIALAAGLATTAVEAQSEMSAPMPTSPNT